MLLRRNSLNTLINGKTYLCAQGLIFQINCKQINDCNARGMNTSFVYPCNYNSVYIRVNILHAARISSLVEIHYVNIMWVQTIIQHKLKKKKRNVFNIINQDNCTYEKCNELQFFDTMILRFIKYY